jgi:anti-anti-sigma factor
MSIAQKEKSGIVVLTLKGRSNGVSAANVEKIIGAVLKMNTSNLFIDLGALVYMSSVDLRVILCAVKAARNEGREVVLCCLNGHVIEVLRDILMSLASDLSLPLPILLKQSKKLLLLNRKEDGFGKQKWIIVTQPTLRS